MRDHRRFLDILRRADEDRAGLRLVDDQTNPFELDFPTVAPIADNDDLWDIEVPAEEVEMEEVSIEDKSLDQVVADLVLDEEEAIEGYENAEEVVAASEEISEDEKDEILDVLNHIKEEEEEHINELTELVGEEETEADETEADSEDNDTDVDEVDDEKSEDGSDVLVEDTGVNYSRKEIADMVATMVSGLSDLLDSRPLAEDLDLHFDSNEINRATAALKKKSKKNTPWIKRVRDWFDDKVIDTFLRSETMYNLALQSPMGREFQDMITELIEGIQQDHFAELEEILIDKALEAGHDFYFEDAELRVVAKADYYNKHKFVADVLDCLRSGKAKNLVDAVQYVNFDTFTFNLTEPQENNTETENN